ncbi:hypothetical protein BHM03_00061894 [Ensete ventricosum]|nr:hypothetical protein BHM03_00061894 [Ensete ventricosum]
MADWALKDWSAVMWARWSDLSYQTRGHHYQMALLDRVHDSGRLVTHMGNQSSLLEVKLEKMKTERDLE